MDLISRQAAIDAIEETDWYHQNQNGEMVHGANSAEHQPWYKADDVYNALGSVPSAERHGTWSEDGGELKCSECHSIFFNDIMDMNKDEMPSFCPVCGARMG